MSEYTTAADNSDDSLLKLLGIEPGTSYTLPCCQREVVVDENVLGAVECPHRCCMITSCLFCGTVDGGWGPVACPCRCTDPPAGQDAQTQVQ